MTNLERKAEAGEVAQALGLSADSIGRYAREGRLPFSTTPGGHRRFSIDEVRQALTVPSAATASAPATSLFTIPAATLRRRAVRSVRTPAPVTTTPAALPSDAPYPSAVPAPQDCGATPLVKGAWRVQRSVPMVTG